MKKIHVVLVSVLVGTAGFHPARAQGPFQAPAARPAPNTSGVARVQHPYRITRLAGPGNQFFIQSVNPETISLGQTAPGKIAISATVNVKYKALGVIMHRQDQPVDIWNNLDHCGVSGNSPTCTAQLDTAGMRDGDYARFVLTLVTLPLDTPGLDSYLVEVPIHRVQTRMRVAPR